MNYSNLFIRWYNNVFHQDPLFQKLNEVSENSPWHRESNIGIHTDMVVSEYVANAGNDWPQYKVAGALAAAFHDVGKPAASERNGIKFKPERGNYLSFGGHEQISARLWEDYAVRNWKELSSTFGLAPEDIYIIGWMIEHHLPWGVKKEEKLNQLARTVAHTCDFDTFADFLLADTYGRISDDEVEKRAKVQAWVQDFYQRYKQVRLAPDWEEGQPRLVMPIGPSGVGKSTLQKEFEDFEHYSWDSLRYDWYLSDQEKLGVQTREDLVIAYKYAFERSCDDRDFGKKVNRVFMDMVRDDKDIYLDNTNLSKKRRRFFVTEARNRGYFIQAVLMPVDQQTLLDRQHSRPEKNVPDHAVIGQYMSMQYPSYGEVDEVIVKDGNLS